MTRTVILGAGIVGVRLAELLRAAGKDWEVCVLTDGQSWPPVSPARMAGIVRAGSDFEGLRYRTREACGALGIVVDERPVQRINVRRKTVALDGGGTVPFDALVLAGTSAGFRIPLKGGQRQGVFHLRDTSRPEGMLARLAVSETVVVQARGPSALDLAAALRGRGKEVLLFPPGARILEGDLAPSCAMEVTELLVEMGIRVLAGRTVVEILGDREVKAVRLDNGKVIAAEIVFWDEAAVHPRLVRETPLSWEGDRLVLDADMRTTCRDVFAVDAFAPEAGARAAGWDSYERCLERQAARLAAVLMGAPVPQEVPLRLSELHLADRRVVLVGETSGRGSRLLKSAGAFFEDGGIRLFVHEGRIHGAVLIGAAEEEIRSAVAWVRDSCPVERDCMRGESLFSEVFAGGPVRPASMAECEL